VGHRKRTPTLVYSSRSLRVLPARGVTGATDSVR
jgi:hypothetical protein